MSFGKSEQAIELSRAVPSKTTRSNSNGTTGADVVRAEVLARIALGHSKRKIARDLHIGRHRIDAILAQHQTAPLSTTRVARMLPLAYDAVEKTLTTNEWPQAGNLGMRLLERTDLAEPQGDSYHVHGDVSLIQAINMVPSLRGATPQPALPARSGSAPSATPQHETTVSATVPSTPPAAASDPPHTPSTGFDKAKALREPEEHALREELAAREERNSAWL